jgi:carbonic anhydrase
MRQTRGHPPLAVLVSLAAVAACLALVGSRLFALGSPEDAARGLKEGNARFAAQHPSHPNAGAARRTETAKGQRPFATVVACSDSRVPVEVLFDRGIGDLFVIRVAGNVCGPTEIGSVEYAVQHLKTPLVVVMGHSQCGAVIAAVDGSQAPGSLPAIVDLIRPAVARARTAQPGLSHEALVAAAIRENVWQGLTDLLTQSSILREAVASKQVQVVGALYDIQSGQVAWLGPPPDQAKLLTQGR